MGMQVCLDLTRLLEEGEGCLVGSSAKTLALVLGETAASGYVPPRPFRCNAGPVHAYIMLADRSTKYLSELRAGDCVLAVRSCDGRARACTIGRLKVEPRPMLKVSFAPVAEQAEEGREEGRAGGQLFLQQAETVRLAARATSSLCTPSEGGMAGDDEGGMAGDDEGGMAGDADLPVTMAKAGDRILVRFTDFGTHVGRAIKAKVTEL